MYRRPATHQGGRPRGAVHGNPAKGTEEPGTNSTASQSTRQPRSSTTLPPRTSTTAGRTKSNNTTAFGGLVVPPQPFTGITTKISTSLTTDSSPNNTFGGQVIPKRPFTGTTTKASTSLAGTSSKVGQGGNSRLREMLSEATKARSNATGGIGSKLGIQYKQQQQQGHSTQHQSVLQEKEEDEQPKHPPKASVGRDDVASSSFNPSTWGFAPEEVANDENDTNGDAQGKANNDEVGETERVSSAFDSVQWQQQDRGRGRGRGEEGGTSSSSMNPEMMTPTSSRSTATTVGGGNSSTTTPPPQGGGPQLEGEDPFADSLCSGEATNNNNNNLGRGPGLLSRGGGALPLRPSTVDAMHQEREQHRRSHDTLWRKHQTLTCRMEFLEAEKNFLELLMATLGAEEPLARLDIVMQQQAAFAAMSARAHGQMTDIAVRASQRVQQLELEVQRLSARRSSGTTCSAGDVEAVVTTRPVRDSELLKALKVAEDRVSELEHRKQGGRAAPEGARSTFVPLTPQLHVIPSTTPMVVTNASASATSTVASSPPRVSSAPGGGGGGGGASAEALRNMVADALRRTQAARTATRGKRRGNATTGATSVPRAPSFPSGSRSLDSSYVD